MLRVLPLVGLAGRDGRLSVPREDQQWPAPRPLDPALGDLLSGPCLPGAACAGRWILFDPPMPDEDEDDVAYRHTAALAVCEFCPALGPCRAAAVEFARQEGSGGFVVAGRVITNPRRTG